MTKKQYDEYQASVERGLKGLEHVSTGPCPGCDGCGLPENPTEAEYDAAQDGGFSWSACDVCGSTLGGDRHPAHGLLQSTKQLVHLNICTDCLYYLEYGQLDDATMMELEKPE